MPPGTAGGRFLLVGGADWDTGPMPPSIRDADGSVRHGRNAAPAEVSVLEVEDRDLDFIRVDHEVRFHFGATQVVVGSSFTVVTDGVEHRLDPERRGELGPVLALYPDVLRELSVGGDGTLRVDLESGSIVTVPPDPHYEAWQVAGPGTRLVVSTAGGASVAVWS